MNWVAAGSGMFPERARVLIEFSSPLPRKAVETCAEHLLTEHKQLGLPDMERVASAIHNLVIGGTQQDVNALQQKNGYVFKLSENDEVLEEVGIRDNVFGYFVFKKDSFDQFLSRLQQLISEPVAKASKICDIQGIKFEGWYQYNSNSTDFGLSGILKSKDTLVPPEIIKGAEQWHSHAGWFHPIESNGKRLLLNRNINVIDQPGGISAQRIFQVHVMAELQQPQHHDLDQIANMLFEHLTFLFSKTIRK